MIESDQTGLAPASLADRLAATAERGDREPIEEPRRTAGDGPVGDDAAEPVAAGAESEAGDAPGESDGAADGDPGHLAAIDPPPSWTTEEQAAFAELPRTLQETLTRREAERERLIEAKAHEARSARSAVEREALATIHQLQAAYAGHLEHFEAQLAVPEPDPRLIAEDPQLYALQLEQHRSSIAQRLEARHLLAEARAQAASAEREMAAREQEEIRAALAAAFPEYLDATSGPKLRETLGATALELGYSPEQLAGVDHVDILAMRKAHEWRQDALKYRALMAKRPERPELPRVSRPGTASTRGAAEGQRYAQDRQRMRDGDRDAARRVFGRFV
jgi:hypothetical protein